MAQNVSEDYKSIISSLNHWFETKVSIGGTEVGENVLMSVYTKNQLFDTDQPSVGCAVAGQITVTLIDNGLDIPRMAEIRPYVRVTDGTDTSEWIPQGVFYLDTRFVTHNDNGLDILTLNGYDAMLKAEQKFPYDNQEKASDVVRRIANSMGLPWATKVDPHVWSIIPVNGGDVIQTSGEYTMREHLQYIGALYGGNWTITNEGKLNLVQLNDIPPETSLLTDESGYTLNFGDPQDDDTPDAQRIVV